MLYTIVDCKYKLYKKQQVHVLDLNFFLALCGTDCLKTFVILDLMHVLKIVFSYRFHSSS